MCFLFLDPQNEIGPSVSSWVVLCSFVILVYIVALVLVFYLCPSSVRVVATFPSTVLYCTVLYCTVLYCTVLYCTVLYCTVLYCTVLHCTVLYCTVLYCTVLYCSQYVIIIYLSSDWHNFRVKILDLITLRTENSTMHALTHAYTHARGGRGCMHMFKA